MIADIRWFAALCLLVQLINVQSRVVDQPSMDIYGSDSDEDPYDEQPFEEDRYEGVAPRDDQSASFHEEEDEDERYTEPRDEGKVEGREERPYRECASPADCMDDECCHIGMERFSMPSCRRQGSEGDFCRVGGEPVNRTLWYPNGDEKEVTDGHILFCPCAQGLTCLRALCRPLREIYMQDGGAHENTL